MEIVKRATITKPDMIEASLIVILAIWIVAVLWLLDKAMIFEVQSLLTWQSLATFFTAFASISVLVVAVLVADIRKEVKEMYR
ncbi:MAG: hypothetical protein QXH80_02420 [Candidatus Nanoarchaeia archaeon]